MTLKFPSIALLLMASISTFSQELPPIENGVSQKLAIWRAANYSDIRYKLNLTIEKKAPTLKGSIEISVNVSETGGNPRAGKGAKAAENRQSELPRGRTDASTLPIILDWRKIKGHENLSKISNVSVNGKTAKFEEINEHLIFSENVKTGENVIKFDFESPILTSRSAITRYIDKEDASEYIYSLFVPSDASTAFPIFDQPDLKARFQLNLTPWAMAKVVSNSQSRLVSHSTSFRERPPVTSSTVVFEETKPISTYVFAFAVGDFAEIEDSKSTTPSRLYVRKSQAKKLLNGGSADIPVRTFAKQTKTVVSNSRGFAQGAADRDVRAPIEEVFRLNRESLKFFEEYFNYKFPFPKYDLVLIPEFPFGGMEHAGATFLRESAVIFPTEPTANNYISRANLIFHENAHQWFGDTVTMKWFDDLWLKEGFATFMAYKAMEKVLPQYNAWKVFYERTKPLAYQTDVTRGTTPIYQEIPNLNSAKSAYGNIVYQKAPGFLRQAEFYLGEKEFQTAVRAFLKNHEFANAEWSDLVKAFEKSSGKDLNSWADAWVKKRSLPIIRLKINSYHEYQELGKPHDTAEIYSLDQEDALGEKGIWLMKTNVFLKFENGDSEVKEVILGENKISSKYGFARYWIDIVSNPNFKSNTPTFIFPNYQDYGYGIFLLDEKSKKYILGTIQNEKDDFLRSMMWGSLWDSVRFSELAPIEYINLAVNHATKEKDVTTVSSILARVNTAFTYYLSERQQAEVAPRLEKMLVKEMNSKSRERQITFYRAFLNLASTSKAQAILKSFLDAIEKESKPPTKKSAAEALPDLPLRTKDKFDIVTKLIILGDKDAPKLLARLEKTETDDDAKRYAYAAKAGFATNENKAKFWDDFINNKEISESWIEEAIDVWNSPSQSALTFPYVEKALTELPNLKRNRKIFFVNGWLSAFIGGQKSEEALEKVNTFLSNNPDLDVDLKRKILEVLDSLERAVKIRKKYSN